MTNYEKAKEKAFERIIRQVMIGKKFEEVQRYIMGMSQAFKIAEFLNADELENFYNECMEKLESQF